MKKGMIILEDGFEQVEALATHDVLHRTHAVDIKLIGGRKKIVESSIGTKVEADDVLNNINIDDYDFIILPGGKVGTDNLKSNPLVAKAVLHFHEVGKHVHAICAAPSVLGELGLLDGKQYTCFPGFQCGKGTYVDTGSVIDGGMVTGHSMGYSLDFAYNIVKVELGEEYLTKINPGIYGK